MITIKPVLTPRQQRSPSRQQRLLSQREHECLLWAARGKTFGETAIILGLSWSTVKRYLDAARWKLNASNLKQATALAAAAGIFTNDALRGRD